MSEIHRVTIDPSQCGGRPCLRGLRIGVRDVLELLATGATREEILADYPLLEAGDITRVNTRRARAIIRFCALPDAVIVDAQLPPAPRYSPPPLAGEG